MLVLVPTEAGRRLERAQALGELAGEGLGVGLDKELDGLEAGQPRGRDAMLQAGRLGKGLGLERSLGQAT